MSASGVEHAVLTRFSVRASAGAPPFPADWLDDRLQLLEAYCLPGLAAQTSSRFRWLVFCDASTDRWCVDRIRRLGREVPGFALVTTTVDGRSGAGTLGTLAEDAETLLTTRLDSDDGLSVDFIERSQRYVPAFLAAGSAPILLNFCRGYKLDAEGDVVYESFHPHSPFLTLFERPGGGRPPTTVLSGNHGFMYRRYPVHEDASAPAWLQVVHAGNVNNAVNDADVEASRSALAGRFALNPRAARNRSRASAPQPRDQAERSAFRSDLEHSVAPSDR